MLQQLLLLQHEARVTPSKKVGEVLWGKNKTDLLSLMLFVIFELNDHCILDIQHIEPIIQQQGLLPKGQRWWDSTKIVVGGGGTQAKSS